MLLLLGRTLQDGHARSRLKGGRRTWGRGRQAWARRCVGKDAGAYSRTRAAPGAVRTAAGWTLRRRAALGPRTRRRMPQGDKIAGAVKLYRDPFENRNSRSCSRSRCRFLRPCPGTGTGAGGDDRQVPGGSWF